MIIGRSAELKYLENCYERDQSQLIVLYGQKNVGKTALVREFCETKPHTYYHARTCSEAQQLALWSAELSEETGESVEAVYPALMSCIAKSRRRKKVVVVDEFQNFVKSAPSFMEEIVKLLYSRKSDQALMIVLVSSSIGWVENSMVSRIGSSAYEITGFLKVREMSFLDVVRRFPKYTTAQCVEVYAVLGGIPGLWKYFSGGLSVRENICRTILKPGTYLSEEGIRHVAEELRETSVYQTLLAAIADGRIKLNDLYQYTGFSRAKISVYLKNLMELEIVEKAFSYEAPGRENVQKGLYRIKSHFVHFWFRYVFPHLSRMDMVSPEEYFDRYIAPTYKIYISGYFAKVCREYMELMNQKDMLEIKAVKSGNWIGKTGTIDIVAEDDEGRTIAGGCNWEKSIMTYEDYQALLTNVERARLKPDYYYLFTAGGFDEKLTLEAKMKNNVHLIRCDAGPAPEFGGAQSRKIASKQESTQWRGL